jgi:hypothetical protein
MASDMEFSRRVRERERGGGREGGREGEICKRGGEGGDGETVSYR